MVPTFRDALAHQRYLETAPPPGAPYALPIPGSALENRSPVYRHWRMQDEPLLKTLDPAVLTGHDIFESAVKSFPSRRCLGSRPWDPLSKTFGNFEWLTYAETATRRKNFGAGLVELHRRIGVVEDKYPIGLWCQNRFEWQLAGMCADDVARSVHGSGLIKDRLGRHVSIAVYRLHL